MNALIIHENKKLLRNYLEHIFFPVSCTYKMPPKKVNTTQQICGYCSDIIRDKTQPSIQCAACRRWFHSKCTNLSSDEFKSIANSIKKKETVWNCDSCASDISVKTCDVLDSDEEASGDPPPSKDIETLLKRHFERFTTNYEREFRDLKTSVLSEIKDLRKEVSKLSEQNVSLSNQCSALDDKLTSVEDKLNVDMRLPTSQEEFFTELSERKRRETNVIALNIPESGKAAGNVHVLFTLPPAQ